MERETGRIGRGEGESRERGKELGRKGKRRSRGEEGKRNIKWEKGDQRKNDESEARES